MAILRRKEEARRKMDQLDGEGRQATTSVNAFELFYGAHKSKMTEKNIAETRTLLSRVLVLPLGLGSAEKAGSVFASLEKKGSAIESRDAMIAGVALDNNLIVVTRNTRGYSKVPGLSVEEW